MKARDHRSATRARRAYPKDTALFLAFEGANYRLRKWRIEIGGDGNLPCEHPAAPWSVRGQGREHRNGLAGARQDDLLSRCRCIDERGEVSFRFVYVYLTHNTPTGLD